jgi:hypothetical protein
VLTHKFQYGLSCVEVEALSHTDAESASTLGIELCYNIEEFSVGCAIIVAMPGEGYDMFVTKHWAKIEKTNRL